ncbi:MAG: photosystem II complex extrinsic protein PsbU [Cyanobacteria bacterium P01_A01_bin.116]
MKRGIKQVLGGLMAAGILMSALLFGNVQPVLSLQLSPDSTTGMALLANAGGRELRNSVDDKLATDYGNKIDVNNTNIASFRKFRGLYPTIAGKVVSNAPYDAVEDVLSIPGLSAVERDRLEKNIDIFTISAPDPALVEGADRFNNGVYK